MPLPHFFCFSFYCCCLYKSSLCGHVPTFSVHVFYGFNLGSYFWKPSLIYLFIYLFVLKCSTLLESSVHNRMRKTMWWLSFGYCQMFPFTGVFDLYLRSLHPGFMSLIERWVIVYSNWQNAGVFFFFSFLSLSPHLSSSLCLFLFVCILECDIEGIHLTFMLEF